jgi:hypothetical protein
LAGGWLRVDDGGVDGNERTTADRHLMTLRSELQWFVGGRPG